MKKVTVNRQASRDEIKTFMKELSDALESMRKRLAKINDGGFELRMSNVGRHEVSAHSRGPYSRPYLARIKK